MTNLETAARIAAKNIRDDVQWYGSNLEETSNWKELIELFGIDSSEMKEEVYYSLRTYYSETGKWSVTDDCSIIEDNGSVSTYRQLVNAIKKELWKR